MRKVAVLFTAVLALLAILVAPARAVTGNYVEDNEHPYVGLAVFYDADGNFIWRCSGSLLTPTVFLTAGHCTDTAEGAASARIYFQQDAGANYDPELGYDPNTGYPLYCADEALCATSDELYNYGFADFQGFPNNKDVGIVILDDPVSLPEYGSLAVAGSLDRLATQRGRQDVTFTVSGYGVSLTNPQKNLSFRERLMAKTQLVNLTSALTSGFNIQLTANPGGGKGGQCFGDSGGPVFYGGFSSDTIVGVVSFGLNQNCRGTGFAYRTDTTAVLNWIRSVVGEDEFARINFVEI